MTKALLALLALLTLLSAHAFAQTAEPKAEILFFAGDRNSDDTRVAQWTAEGFHVTTLEVGPGEELPADLTASGTHHALFVAGSGVGAPLAIRFSELFPAEVQGALLLGPELQGREVLTAAIPVLVERVDAHENLKRWVRQQMQMGRSIQDIGFFEESQLHQKFARRLSSEFINAVLAGSIQRVVP